MLPLPVQPESLPDELIGHRLARTIDLNGLHDKHVLLKWLGFDRSERGSQLMDVIVLTQRWINLADKLCIDLETLIEQQSTKPYWACFYTNRKGERAIADSRLTKLSVPAAGLYTRSHTRLELQFCPCCMVEDERAYGSAYAHRSHQLPATMVCHKHRAFLLDRCLACGRILRPFMDIARARSRCECGYDLTRSAYYCHTSDIEYRLAAFEKSCLDSTYQCRPASDAITFLMAVAKQRNHTLGDLVIDAMGPHMNCWLRRNRVKEQVDHRFYPATYGTPAIAAGFVALGFDFDEAQSALASAMQDLSPQRRRRGELPHPDSVKSARSELLAMKDSGRTVGWLLRRRSPYVFWYLALRDRAWLEKQLGPPRTPLKIPTIKEDRVTLSARTSCEIRVAASARAGCRDLAWLQHHLVQRREGRRAARDQAMIGAIRSAMADSFNSPGRPVKFGCRSIAAVIGLSLAGVQLLLGRNPSLKDLLRESATGYRLRVLMWMLQNRSNPNARLSANFLVKEAGLENTATNRFYAASIIHLFSTVGADLASWT